MSGTELKDRRSEAFEKRGYIVSRRKNHCDVLAVNPNMRARRFFSNRSRKQRCEQACVKEQKNALSNAY